MDHEIVVVDDASTDETAEMLAGYGDAVRHVRLDRNAGFATACNTGAAAARGRATWSSSTTTPSPSRAGSTPWWRTPTRTGGAVVGSKLLFPDGTVQHAGVVFGLLGDPLHLYAGCPADHPAVNKSRPFQSVTAACMLVRRAAFEEAGGFDTGYHNDLEDVDLCLRLGELATRSTTATRASCTTSSPSPAAGATGPRTRRACTASGGAGRVRNDELDYYLEDGLLDLLRISPETVEGKGPAQARARPSCSKVAPTSSRSCCARPSSSGSTRSRPPAPEPRRQDEAPARRDPGRRPAPRRAAARGASWSATCASCGGPVGVAGAVER